MFFYCFSYENGFVWICGLKENYSLGCQLQNATRMGLIGLLWTKIWSPQCMLLKICGCSQDSTSRPSFSFNISDFAFDLFIRVVGLSLIFSKN